MNSYFRALDSIPVALLICVWNLPFSDSTWACVPQDACDCLYEQVVDVDAAFSWHRRGRRCVFSLAAEPQMLLGCICVSFVYLTFICLAFCWRWDSSQLVESVLRICLFLLSIFLLRFIDNYLPTSALYVKRRFDTKSSANQKNCLYFHPNCCFLVLSLVRA